MYEGLKPCPQRRVDDGGRILCGLIRSGDKEVSVNLCRACPVPQINCQHLRATMQKRASTPITVRYSTGRVEVWDDDPPTIDFKQAACAAKTMPIHSPRDCAGCPLRQPHVIPERAIQVAKRVQAEAMRADPSGSASAPKLVIEEIPAVAARADAPIQSLADANLQPGRAQPQPVAENAVENIAQRGHAAKKQAEARRATASAQPMETRGAPTERKSKIIQLQQWLTDQFAKKPERLNAHRLTSEPDVDGVQEIIYAPLESAQYNEHVAMERCVGWTD